MSELYSTAALHRMARYDAKTEIWKSVGSLDDLQVFGTQLVLAPYVHSGVMLSERLGIPETERLSCEALYDLYDSGRGFLNPQLAKEDIFQSKVYMVVKIGSEVDVSEARYGDAPLAVGDWVMTLQENTRAVSLYTPGAKQSRVLKAIGVDYTGWPCKFCYAADVYGRVTDPDMVA